MKNNKGSEWRKWDLHIHSPYTFLNNQFNNDWDSWTRQIVNSGIKAIGLTNYFRFNEVDGINEIDYARSKLSSNGIIVFPNLEFRIGQPNKDSEFINLHIIFSDKISYEKIKNFLTRLQLDNSKYCQDLSIEKEFETATVSKKTLEIQLKDFIFLEDYLVVCCPNGYGGFRADNKVGRSVEVANLYDKMGNFFFARPQDKDFFLRNDRYENSIPKAVIHSSDAHKISDIGTKYTWIKADLTFEGLKQILFEPDTRVHFTENPPTGAFSGNTITKIIVNNAAWLKEPEIELNKGLIAIIGSRGSGKTALADIIATGANDLSWTGNEKSFIRRAYNCLTDTSSKISWESGEETNRELTNPISEVEPLVQYLSQQFVDQLCRADGLNDALINEIEKVIFNAHNNSEKYGNNSFKELLEFKAQNARNKRSNYEKELETLSERLNKETEFKAGKTELEKRKDNIIQSIKKDKDSLNSFYRKGKEERIKQLDELKKYLDEKNSQINIAKRKLSSIEKLITDVNDLKNRRIRDIIFELKENNQETGLTEEEWKNFSLEFKPEVEQIIRWRKDEYLKNIKAIEESSIHSSSLGKTILYKELNFQISEILKEVSIDKEFTERIEKLSKRISDQELELKRIDTNLERAKKAEENIKIIIDERTNTYRNIFESIIEEEIELNSLYTPLKNVLIQKGGSIKNISFSVKRNVDINKWIEQCEDELLDLRKMGAFRGKGTMLELAKKDLLEAWRTGDAKTISLKMQEFRNEYDKDFLMHSPYDIKDSRHIKWRLDLGKWLYGTHHINISYSLNYNGIDIAQLSPGTRGIVLLMLYLALDIEDSRPLIIDQPEENLDPQSIYKELVPLFKEAKKRRQIIIVTHNANLVVNTDADQVIIASAGIQNPESIPEISYKTGSLENPEIRKEICEILEGGDKAFRERAKRLRISI